MEKKNHNKRLAVILIIAIILIALVPLFTLKNAEFGGSDDAGSQMVNEITGIGIRTLVHPCTGKRPWKGAPRRGGKPVFLCTDRYRRRHCGLYYGPSSRTKKVDERRRRKKGFPGILFPQRTGPLGSFL